MITLRFYPLLGEAFEHRAQTLNWPAHLTWPDNVTGWARAWKMRGNVIAYADAQATRTGGFSYFIDYDEVEFMKEGTNAPNDRHRMDRINPKPHYRL